MHPEDTGRIESALWRRARDVPQSAAIVDGERVWSYDALAALVAGGASRLRAAGVHPDDRVVIFLDKTVESAAALYAVWAAGAIAVPANEGLRSRQVRHIIDDSGARVIVSNLRKVGRLDPGTIDGLALVDLTGAAEEGRGRTFDDQGAGGKTPAAILYTSGSTGRPKGILISHGNLIAGSRIVSGYLEMQPDERVLSVLPFSFDYGLNQLLNTVRVGGTLFLQRSHFAPDICRTLERHRITLMAAVPPLWIQLMDRLSPFEKMAFPDLRTITNSGGVFPIELVARYRARLPQARVFLMYGLSEAFRSTFLPPALIDTKPGSMGKAIPETEVMVVDSVDDGRGGFRLCADDEPGELVHRGPTVALGYWQNPEATAARFRPHPFAPASGETVVFSGDVVRRDADGFLHFVGRRDQMIKTQGYRVSPEEVEEIIYASGLVSEAAVRGEPDPTAGTAIVAHLVPRDPATFSIDELLGFCRREMPSYMVPKAVRLHRSLPRTGSGKLDRQAVAS
jgi:acyl-CoA ligase (AMP-forming) (exosortase A-associated)